MWDRWYTPIRHSNTSDSWSSHHRTVLIYPQSWGLSQSHGSATLVGQPRSATPMKTSTGLKGCDTLLEARAKPSRGHLSISWQTRAESNPKWVLYGLQFWSLLDALSSNSQFLGCSLVVFVVHRLSYWKNKRHQYVQLGPGVFRQWHRFYYFISIYHHNGFEIKH